MCTQFSYLSREFTVCFSLIGAFFPAGLDTSGSKLQIPNPEFEIPPILIQGEIRTLSALFKLHKSAIFGDKKCILGETY